MKKGFTLLELIVVIIILGILATIGFTQYTKVVEKGRVAEANSILGTIRTTEKAYNLEKGGWGDLVAIGLDDLPSAACDGKYYFTYSVDTGAGTATATRCTSGGKTPDYSTAYTVTVDIDAGTITGGP